MSTGSTTKTLLLLCCSGLILTSPGCMTTEYIPAAYQNDPDFWHYKYEQEKTRSLGQEERDYQREQTRLLREQRQLVEEERKALRDHEETCPTCGGVGEIICPTCLGRLYLGRCNACGGSGKRVCPGCARGEGSRCRHNHDSRGRIFCVVCMGSGKDRCPRCDYLGTPTGTVKCNRCSGRGTIK